MVIGIAGWVIIFLLYMQLHARESPEYSDSICRAERKMQKNQTATLRLLSACLYQGSSTDPLHFRSGYGLGDNMYQVLD